MPEIEVPCPTCAGTIVPDHASVVAALSRRAAEILARHGYPEKPLTGDIDLGMLPIADMAALASSPTPDGVIKDRGEDGRRPDGPGLSHSVSSPSVSPAAAASIPGAGAPAAWIDVLAERRRQVSEEWWTPQHDDKHTEGEIARAGACYAYMAGAGDDGRRHVLATGVPYLWPWSREWWKPTDRRRDLVKAGALILAEIERLDRASALIT